MRLSLNVAHGHAHGKAFDIFEEIADALLMSATRGNESLLQIAPFFQLLCHEAVPLFARWVATAARDAIAGADLVIPVPLHWRRLAARRYNQAALLAAALGSIANKPVDTATLVRVKPTPSQGEMPSARARAKNVVRAFAIRGSAKVVGRNIVLVDDVLTTGATVSACSKVLLKAGAGRVSVVTLARVVRPLSLTL